VRPPTGSGERLVSCDRGTNEHELYVAAVSDCSRLARRATHRIFTLYLGNPISSILTILFILSTKGYPC
jgi:hypothetical protein